MKYYYKVGPLGNRKEPCPLDEHIKIGSSICSLCEFNTEENVKEKWIKCEKLDGKHSKTQD